MQKVVVFAAGVLILLAAIYLRIRVGNWHALYGLLLVAVLPLLAIWGRLPERSGTLMMDLGRPDGPKYLSWAAVFSMFLLGETLRLLTALHNRTAGLGDWFGPALFLLMACWSVLGWRRGLSIREAGVLSPDSLAEWSAISFWSCDREQGTLSIGVKGAGLVRALTANGPMSDTVKTWRVPADHLDAVEALLAQQAPNAGVEPPQG